MLEAVPGTRAAVAGSRAGCAGGPDLDFDKDTAVADLRAVMPGIPVCEISARNEAGFGPWVERIEANVLEKRKGGPGRE